MGGRTRQQLRSAVQCVRGRSRLPGLLCWTAPDHALCPVVSAGIAGAGVGLVLLPYWISIIKHPIEQMPIPHASRSNLLLNLTFLTNYFFVPYGMLIFAFPFVAWYGAANRRLRPLLFGFWITFL